MVTICPPSIFLNLRCSTTAAQAFQFFYFSDPYTKKRQFLRKRAPNPVQHQRAIAYPKSNDCSKQKEQLSVALELNRQTYKKGVHTKQIP
jgi:hypothetical protein